MRLWTLHPCHLDPQGLVALWREGLLARAVLRGQTRGYRHHPQLQRFQAHATPVHAINAYLAVVHQEAARRGYHFDRSRIGPVRRVPPIDTTDGQLAHEWQHLLRKLQARSPALHAQCCGMQPQCHPMFVPHAGGVAPWERA